MDCWACTGVIPGRAQAIPMRDSSALLDDLEVSVFNGS
jgi:hypothetical protein